MRCERREGLSFKKTLFALEQARPEWPRHRRWQALQAGLDPRRLVLHRRNLDQDKHGSRARLGPEGPAPARLSPQGRWRTLSFLGALRWDGITAPCIFDGPINGQYFRAYVEQLLLPALRPGDIVVLDNLGSHKAKTLRPMLEAVGARLWYLPPYPPDLNPIEKPSPRSSTGCAQKRTPEGLSRCVGKLLKTIRPGGRVRPDGQAPALPRRGRRQREAARRLHDDLGPRAALAADERAGLKRAIEILALGRQRRVALARSADHKHAPFRIVRSARSVQRRWGQGATISGSCRPPR
ncbi:transposase [Reyranella sp.]|uniref:transposase n=1 Tax=Reyranella sp. TaxID=1929291 RepID=UPI0025D46D4E|nr:transposase [Reyranella sp.]